MTYWIAAISIFSFIASVAGVAAVRNWSLSRNVIDVPNERSSHSHPTPRGGGIMIFVVGLAAYLVYGLSTGTGVSWGLTVGAVMIAVVSFVDDLGHVWVPVRFGVHIAAAALAVADTGGFATLFPEFGWIVYPASVLWIVWLVNAYNFMDGIDGIAAVQAVTAGAGWAVIGSVAGAPAVSVLGTALAAGSAGFLVHNWAPARIFMGDVGAAFLGFAFAVIPFLGTGADGADMQSVAVFPVWFFLLDSLYTLVRRAVRGEKVWRAHREHIYQRLVIAGMGHRAVTSLYGILSATVAFVGILVVAGPKFPRTFAWLAATLLSALLPAVAFWKSRA